MYLYFKCMCTSNVFALQMYLYFKCMCASNVFALQMYLYLKCICTSNVYVLQMYLDFKCMCTSNFNKLLLKRFHCNEKVRESREGTHRVGILFSGFWSLESGFWIWAFVCAAWVWAFVRAAAWVCTSNVFVFQMYVHFKF